MVFLTLLGFPVFQMTGVFLSIAQAGVSKLYCFTIETDIPLSLCFIQCILKKTMKMSKLLIVLKYDQFIWQVIGNFKMVAFLMGLQGGFTKFSYYLCYWDTRDTNLHYHRRILSKRTKFSVGKNKVKWDPLIDPSKILIPPLHIKLGLIKQFCKALDKNSEAFKYFKNLFSKLSEAKIKAVVFIGPQIRKILECTEFFKKTTNNRKGSLE